MRPEVAARGTRDAWIAAALGAAALVLYLAAAPPSYAFWDTGELQTVSVIFGIAHPPACPAFVVLGWLFAHGVPVGEPAWRVTAMCATAVAVAVALLFATLRRFDVPPGIAALCTLGFAAASPTLKYATRAEVHDVALAFSAAAFFFGVRYTQGGRMGDLFGAAVGLGLCAATHGTALMLAPAIALLALVRPETRSVRALVLVVAGFALGLAPYAYLPYRSAWLLAHRVDPTLALGLPPGAPFWDYGHPADWPALWAVVTGAQFHVRSGFAGYLDVARYPGFAGALAHRLGAAYGLVGTIAADAGALWLVLRRDVAGAALVLAALLPVPYTESYADLQDPDRYYLLALWCAAIAIGIAFEGAADLLQQPRRGIVRFGLAAALAGVFVAADPARAAIFEQRHDYGAGQYVAYLKSVTPDDAVVFADWAYATPLAYAAYVEHNLGNRIAFAAGADQYPQYFAGWLAQGRKLYYVSFDDDAKLPGHLFERVSEGQAYYVYRVIR